jgi:pyrroloquinoline quinone biosynthesis protein B
VSERGPDPLRLRVLILGAAAGGGFPQWNCACPNCAAYWRGEPGLKASTQSSIAISADGEQWLLINASPDLRAQILATPKLQPGPPDQHGRRNSPIRSVLLTNGDVDHVAGLLTLRERQPFTLFATAEILEIVADNPVFGVLNPEFVQPARIEPEQTFEPLPGLSLTLFSVPGKTPLYLEGATVETDLLGEQTVGVCFEAGGRRGYYVPGCAAMPVDLKARLDGASLLLFDGTVFEDAEMAHQGVGEKTGRRMGHMSMMGPEGSIAAFRDLDIERKIFVHINNTNPVLMPGSEARATATAAGWEIGADGLQIDL